MVVGLDASSLAVMAEAALPHWDDSLALYIGIDMRAFRPGNHGPSDAAGSLHLLIHKASNYKTVWAQNTRDILPGHHRIKDWGRHVVHHDSCWRDEIRSQTTQLYFDLCKEAAKDLAPKDVDFRAHVWSAELLRVEVSRVTREGELYADRLVKILGKIEKENRFSYA